MTGVSGGRSDGCQMSRYACIAITESGDPPQAVDPRMVCLFQSQIVLMISILEVWSVVIPGPAAKLTRVRLASRAHTLVHLCTYSSRHSLLVGALGPMLSLLFLFILLSEKKKITIMIVCTYL